MHPTRFCKQPRYLFNPLISYRHAATLQSSSSNLLVIPNHVTTATAARDFRVAAPTIWNNLPDAATAVESFCVFKRSLKRVLFNRPFQPAKLSRSSHDAVNLQICIVL